MSKAAYAVYQRTQNVAEEPRDVEYRLLGQVTAALMDAERDPQNAQKLVEAVLWNRSVWSAFKIDLLNEGNRLPADLRGKLVSLALWVERESSEILSFKSDLSWVIGVNKRIMEGLKPKVAVQATSPSAGPAVAPVAFQSTAA